MNEWMAVRVWQIVITHARTHTNTLVYIRKECMGEWIDERTNEWTKELINCYETAFTFAICVWQMVIIYNYNECMDGRTDGRTDELTNE